MASRDLILRIGADAGPIKKALGQLNNTLVKTADKLESIGQSLSLRLTAPIVGAGVASVAAFAKFEKFEKSLRAVSSSAAEADATLSRLRKLALQPGIDLENAVTGSIRLQAVGFEAKKAEELILQFSKAVTLAGGTGEDLGEVVRQITQIISKGKVLSSDFRVIQERVPAIGIALQTAFGSTNIEQIRETGISAADFVDKLTDGIRASQEFQNVQGGLSNSFNNFQQSVEGSLVVLGRTISETINLDEILDRVSNTIADAANDFSNLSPNVKTLILSVSGLAAALGPLLFGLGALIKTLPLLRAGFATLFGPVGLVVTAIAALALVIAAASIEIDSAAEAQKQLNAATSEAADQTKKETDAVNSLVGVIQDETASKGQKAEAIERLKRISPEYFGGLDVEKTKTEELTKISDEYNKALAVRNDLQAINAKSAAAQEELAKINKQIELNAVSANKSYQASFGTYAGQVELTTKKLEDQRKVQEQIIEQAREAATGLLASPGAASPSTPKIASGIDKPISKALKKINSSLAAADEKFKLFGSTISTTKEKTAILQSGITKLLQLGLSPTSNEVVKLVTALKGLQGNITIDNLGADDLKIFNSIFEESIQLTEKYSKKLEKADLKELKKNIITQDNPLKGLIDGLDSAAIRADLFGSKFDLIGAQFAVVSSELNNAIDSGAAFTTIDELIGRYKELESVVNGAKNAQAAYTSAFEAASSSQIKSFADVGRAAINAAKDVVKAKILEATASFFADAFAKLGIFGAVLAAGSGAIVGGLFSATIGKIGVPALAEGGIATGPTLALIGEGRENEAIIPLSKLDTIINNGSGGQQELTARISGEDLLLLIRRVQTTENRIG